MTLHERLTRARFEVDRWWFIKTDYYIVDDGEDILVDYLPTEERDLSEIHFDLKRYCHGLKQLRPKPTYDLPHVIDGCLMNVPVE